MVWAISLVSAQINESTSLTEIEFSELTQRDPNPLGEKAMAIHPDQWKHAETEHFIYHFTHSYVATPVSVEAEFHYRVVAKELERDQPPGDTKSHIYIFEGAEDWQQFQSYGQLEKWTGGIHSMGSLFIQRDPKNKFAGNTLGHEIVHLIVHRFYSDGVPCWLNEGLAQYISKARMPVTSGPVVTSRNPIRKRSRLRNSFRYRSSCHSPSPPNDNVKIFYDQSERLVRFLASENKPGFLSFLDMVARHQPFETALARAYAAKFPTAPCSKRNFAITRRKISERHSSRPTTIRSSPAFLRGAHACSVLVSTSRRNGLFRGAQATLPALFGSLPKRIVAGKLPTTTGWQPVVPRRRGARTHLVDDRPACEKQRDAED